MAGSIALLFQQSLGETGMANYKVEDIRNIAIVGHGTAGKTSLTEALLFKAGAVSRQGSVDDGSSVSDFDDLEKKHKYSIDSSFVHLEHKGHQIHILDTPGYPDFVGAPLGVLNAVETAVLVISAFDGIKVNTRRMFNEAGKRNLGRLIVINKMDAENVNFQELIDTIRGTFGTNCVLFDVPVGQGSEFSGVVSVLNPPSPLPPGCLIDANTVRSQLIDGIVESDEALMEKYLSEGDVTQEELLHALPHAMAMQTVIPIFCTSAKTGVGIEQLFEAISEFALSPKEGPKPRVQNGESEIEVEPNVEGEFIGQCFKTVHDKFVGTLNYIRVYSGRITPENQLFNQRSGKSSRIPALLMMQGKDHANLTEAIAGDIFAVAKLEDLHTGDTVGTGGKGKQLAKPAFPMPMFGLAIEPKARGDEQKISGSLAKIADEDPTFHVHRDMQTKELVVNGMSQLHLDVIRERLKLRYGLEVITHEPKIPYRETVTANAEASYRHKKQSGGRGQFGEVHLRVYPLPPEVNSQETMFANFATKANFEKIRVDNCAYVPEHNFAFIDHIVGGTIPNQFIPAVLKGCKELLERGALAGYMMQNLAVEVHFGKDHPVDSSETAFKIAGRLAFREAFKKAHPVLLEPIVEMEVTFPMSYTGDILSDLNTKRARIEDQGSLPGDLAAIKCKVPLSEVARYQAQLGSITQGSGSYTMDFSHYDVVPPNVQQQIISKATLAADEDEG
jgi:elongation factor G